MDTKGLEPVQSVISQHDVMYMYEIHVHVHLYTVHTCKVITNSLNDGNTNNKTSMPSHFKDPEKIQLGFEPRTNEPLDLLWQRSVGLMLIS